MLRMLGMVLVVGASTTLGLSARQRLSHRVRSLTQFIQAFDLLIAEMQSNQTPLPQLISMLTQEDIGESTRFFKILQKRMQTNADLSFSYHWQTTARDLAEDLGLESGEVEALRQAASYLGRYQAEQQLTGLMHTREQLVGICRQARQMLETKGNLYRTCGIAVGVVVVLMML